MLVRCLSPCQLCNLRPSALGTLISLHPYRVHFEGNNSGCCCCFFFFFFQITDMQLCNAVVWCEDQLQFQIFCQKTAVEWWQATSLPTARTRWALLALQTPSTAAQQTHFGQYGNPLQLAAECGPCMCPGLTNHETWLCA